MAETFSYRETDPDSLLATWGPLRLHSLAWHEGWDLPSLLDAWETRLTGRDDLDTAAVVTVPSHETASTLPLIHRGFAPLTVIAERLAGRTTPARPSDVVVRPAVRADLDVAVEINMHTVRYDTAFGMVTERPNTAEHLRAALAEVLDRGHEAMWLAVSGDTPVGMLYVDMPQDAAWMDRFASARPFAYLGHLGVRPDARGTGAGSALLAHAHEVLDSSGVASTLLHHALPNPRSTPFWNSNGYRPRWTTWVRRPALRASSGVSAQPERPSGT
ncbi:GNAT family N-acetyltransferase [Lentzea sp. NBRC 102530]|uniref:GNAT family N-acetyltransferase n=1 Tax=Lentzea sp. NBRC 102530 TaxID=3032201 RepID=UPI0024A133E6|nr:GNAT family N-acetyltransferase [Lentzea sp. NBRC 102530]GLY52181.1 N-acetyltransferase [Lentzea sp. NBRC 102530]